MVLYLILAQAKTERVNLIRKINYNLFQPFTVSSAQTFSSSSIVCPTSSLSLVVSQSIYSSPTMSESCVSLASGIKSSFSIGSVSKSSSSSASVSLPFPSRGSIAQTTYLVSSLDSKSQPSPSLFTLTQSISASFVMSASSESCSVLLSELKVNGKDV